MKSLVQTLKAQHQAVQQMTVELDEALELGDAAVATALLEKLKAALLSHLELEDRELYPGLLQLAEAQRQDHLAKVAKMFSSNMAFITGGVKRFLAQHERVTDTAAFRDEWRGILKVLQQRIHSEECTLYPLFEHAVSASVPKASVG